MMSAMIAASRSRSSTRVSLSVLIMSGRSTARQNRACWRMLLAPIITMPSLASYALLVAAIPHLPSFGFIRVVGGKGLFVAVGFGRAAVGEVPVKGGALHHPRAA